MNKYCFGINIEDFEDFPNVGYETFSEAFNAGIEYARRYAGYSRLYRAKVFYVGEEEPTDFNPYIDPDDIIDYINNAAIENGGEQAEGYLLGVTTEQKIELEKLLNSALMVWIEKHDLQPSWYIFNIKKFNAETGEEIV